MPGTYTSVRGIFLSTSLTINKQNKIICFEQLLREDCFMALQKGNYEGLLW